jgi:hypothetical protein
MSATPPSNGSGGATPPEVQLEYTRGTGALFPTFTTAAIASGVGGGTTSVNGQSGAVVIASPPGANRGVVFTVSTGQAAGEVDINGVLAVPIGTSLPGTANAGELFYVQGTGLFLWDGAAWQPA